MLFFPASIGRKDVFATRRRSRSHLRDLLFISLCARATALTSVSSLVCSCISAGGRAVHLVFGACWCLLGCGGGRVSKRVTSSQPVQIWLTCAPQQL